MHQRREERLVPPRVVLPFFLLGIVFVGGASSTLLPAGLAFALVVACVLIGSLRVLLLYRDRLAVRDVAQGKR